MSDVSFAVMYFASGTAFGVLLILFAAIIFDKYSVGFDDEDDDDTDGGDEEKPRKRI